MSDLPEDFFVALKLLGRASERYRKATGRRVVLVGGAAVSLYSYGQILSGDFDIVADIDFENEMINEGFLKEDRKGYLMIGYYHPEVPRYGFQLVSGDLFDGRSDLEKMLPLTVSDSEDSQVYLPAIEDLIADRLGQFAASDNKDDEMRQQASLLRLLALDIDEAYLRRRILDEGGDPSLVGLSDA